jgi:ribosomal protein L31
MKIKRSAGFSAQDFELLLRECSVFAERMCGRALVSVSTRVMTIQISFDVCCKTHFFWKHP